jgi:hypothetical protein
MKMRAQNFAMAQSKRLILREERNFVEAVEGTMSFPSPKAEKENVNANAS